MRELTKREAHVILGAIRVLEHLKERSPTPDEVADLLNLSPSAVRLQLAHLAEDGVVALVESAYETCVEVRDYQKVEAFTETDAPEISEDLRDFDERKRAETEKMAHLFDSGEHEKQQREKLDRMDTDLEEFRKRKTPNPFGDD